MEGTRWRRGSRRGYGSVARLWAEIASPAAQPMLAAASAMVVLHLLEVTGLIDTSASSVSFNLEVDRSLGELFGYVVLATVIAGLVTLARREGGDRLLFFVAGVFALALADDVLTIHEAVGHVFASVASGRPIASVDAAEVGQAVYFGAIAVLVIVGWRRLQGTATDAGRHIARWVMGFLVVFGMFAAGLDLLHELLRTRTTALEPLLVPLEDGGELVVLALLASFVFARVLESDAIGLDEDPLLLVDDLVIDLRSPTAAAEDAASSSA